MRHIDAEVICIVKIDRNVFMEVADGVWTGDGQ